MSGFDKQSPEVQNFLRNWFWAVKIHQREKNTEIIILTSKVVTKRKIKKTKDKKHD